MPWLQLRLDVQPPEVAELEDEEREEFLADLGIDEPGLNRVIRAGYKLLGLGSQ